MPKEKECYLYEKYKKGKNTVRCFACSQRCVIADGKRGVCGIRENRKGKLYALTYSKIAAVHVDPVEKKPLFHFLPGSRVFSIGTVGCDFRCLFCQNYSISQPPRETGEIFGEQVTPEEVVKMAIEASCPSIAYTYTEPAVFIEMTHDTAKIAHEKGIKNIYVTNGYETKEALDLMEGLIDAMNIDLKSFSDDFYLKICGARLQPVLDTIKRAYKRGIWIEVTTLVIPGHNDSDKELKKIAEFIVSIDKDIPWHISRFFPYYKMLDVEATPHATLLKAYNIGKKAGLNYVYLGNVEDPGHESTYCPKCNEVVISRLPYYGIEEIKLKDNKCQKCSTKISGVFNVE